MIKNDFVTTLGFIDNIIMSIVCVLGGDVKVIIFASHDVSARNVSIYCEVMSSNTFPHVDAF